MSEALRDEAIRRVVREFGSTRGRILSSTRGKAQDAWVRAIAIYAYAGRYPRRVNWSEVGRMFDRERSSVRYAAGRVEAKALQDADFQERVMRVSLVPIAQR